MADSFTLFNLSVFKEIRVATKPYNIIPCASGGFLVQYRNSVLVSRFDVHYNLLWELPIGDRLNQFELTISPDGQLIGVCGLDVVRVFNGDGQLLFLHTHFRREMYQSSGCYFHVDDSGQVDHILFFEPSRDRGGFLQMFDAGNFNLIKSLSWRDMDNHFSFYPTLDPSKTLIALAAGQDGSQLLLLKFANNNIGLAEQEQCANLVIGNFSPSGDEFVAIEHDDQYLAIYSFPAMEQIAKLDSESVFTDNDDYPGEDTDNYEYVAYFLSNKTILVKTRFGRLLVIDRDTLQRTGELILEGCSVIGYDDRGKPASDPKEIIDYQSEAEQVFLTSTGDLLVIHTNGSIRVYKLPD